MPCAEMLSPMIQSGGFDEVLTKPLNPLLYMSCSTFCYGYFSHVTLSVVIIVICFIKLGIVVTPVKILFLVLTALSGALIQGAAFLFTSVPSFWLTRNNGLRNIMWISKYYVEYPLSIYNKAVQVILTLIIPYAFVNFYPAQYFLGKHDFLMFHPVFQYLSPVVGIILFAGACRFWNIGLRHYKSTGS
jgi:ABC-2 type transport system permease protein